MPLRRASLLTFIALPLVAVAAHLSACDDSAEATPTPPAPTPMAGSGGASTGAGGSAVGGSGGAGGTSSGGSKPQGGSSGRFCDLPVPAAAGLTVPEGFCAREYIAPGMLKVPRVMRFSPQGDLFIVSPGVFTPGGASGGLGAIVVAPDDNHDGIADNLVTYAGQKTDPKGSPCAEHETNPEDLFCVHGLAFADGYLYYSRSDEVRRYPFTGGRMAPEGPGELVAGLGGAAFPDIRWTHTIERDADGTLIVSRGRTESSDCSASSLLEGAVLRVDVSGQMPTVANVITDGFRNPMYLRCKNDRNFCFAAELSGDSWLSVGGREKLALIVQGQKWGYPCCIGPNEPSPVNKSNPELCADVSAEVVAIPLHDTPFGFDYEPGNFPAPYKNGVFVANHGAFASWVGTQVVYLDVDPATGYPMGEQKSFMTGWGNDASSGLVGRATELVFAPDGRMFVADDTSGGVWWVAPVDLPLPPGW